MHLEGGLYRFRERLHPAVARQVMQWQDHPELAELCASLLAHTDAKPFFDAYAEAMVARHLIDEGCELRFEVPTPAGKQCDFQVQRQGEEFFLHVKRLDNERPLRRRLAISSRLRYLERLPRPYVVSVRWHEGLSDEQMQQFVQEAAAFIGQASVGDEQTVRAESGRELGGVRIVAPWEGTHVNLTIGLPSGFIDQTQRIRRLMKRAYQQFMPKATNVILICSSLGEDAEDFETALLGSHVERWDAHPPRGRRIAHGRDADGFWHEARHGESRAAGWFQFSPRCEGLTCQCWHRMDPAPDPGIAELLGDLFELAGQ